MEIARPILGSTAKLVLRLVDDTGKISTSQTVAVKSAYEDGLLGSVIYQNQCCTIWLNVTSVCTTDLSLSGVTDKLSKQDQTQLVTCA